LKKRIGISFENMYSIHNNQKIKIMSILKNHNANLLNEIFNNFPSTWGKDVQTNYYAPAVNIHQTDDAYHIELIAPGREKSEFKIQIDKGFITVSYETNAATEQKNIQPILREFSLKNFKRSFSIDDTINTEAILANYENGILKLLLPKKEEVKIVPKEITVQ
jgi:HSP20 family protein